MQHIMRDEIKQELIDYWLDQGFECELDGGHPQDGSPFLQFSDSHCDRIAFVRFQGEWTECKPLVADGGAGDVVDIEAGGAT